MTDQVVAEEKEGKRGVTFPWLLRMPLGLGLLSWEDQNVWRTVVHRQPIAVLCRETIVEQIVAMDWRIDTVDPNEREERRDEINYYTDLLLYNDGDIDFIDFTTWMLEDALDIPFGGVAETVREGDLPEGKLMYYVPLDGATFYPTNNRQFPAIQRPPNTDITRPIVFPKHAMNRIYYSPRREMKWRGWGMPPPEKIYMAMAMLSQGDQYYWKLLIDTPEVGLLDLMDMDKESAEEWIQAFRDLMTGVDPFKIPVLYQHEKPANYLSFTRPPTEIEFGSAIHRYSAITCAGYGLSLSDIGLSVVGSNGGNTLAGTIREERAVRKKGIGLAKKKVKLFFDRMLPKYLKFHWIDPDEEQQVAKGRALLSRATANDNFIKNRILSPTEARLDLSASGLLSIPIPETLPDDPLFDEINQANQPQKRENMLTATVPASTGGQGEVRMSRADKAFMDAIERSVYESLSDESLMLDDDEFLEGLVPLNFNVDIISDEFVQNFVQILDQQKRSKSIFNLSRYRSTDDAVKEFAEYCRNELHKIEQSFTNRALAIKSDIDRSNDFRIRLMEQIVNEYADRISAYINQKITEI